MMVARYLFGHDVFISYARIDGMRYASALATHLVASGLSCFVDQWSCIPGKQISRRILRTLKRSSILVIVGTEAASASEAVLDEVRAFKPTQRSIIPIDVQGSLRQGLLAEELLGLPLEVETSAAIDDGRPSERLISRLEGAVTFTKQSSRIRRASFASFLLILLAIGAAISLEVMRNQLQHDIVSIEAMRNQLQHDIERAVSIDQSDFNNFEKPYKEMQLEAERSGSIWTGDPVSAGDPNIDDLPKKKTSLKNKWGKHWSEQYHIRKPENSPTIKYLWASPAKEEIDDLFKDARRKLWSNQNQFPDLNPADAPEGHGNAGNHPALEIDLPAE
jgi:hypothetical protein